jgi:hypothetical protein
MLYLKEKKQRDFLDFTKIMAIKIKAMITLKIQLTVKN